MRRRRRRSCPWPSGGRQKSNFHINFSKFEKLERHLPKNGKWILETFRFSKIRKKHKCLKPVYLLSGLSDLSVRCAAVVDGVGVTAVLPHSLAHPLPDWPLRRMCRCCNCSACWGRRAQGHHEGIKVQPWLFACRRPPVDPRDPQGSSEAEEECSLIYWVGES